MRDDLYQRVTTLQTSMTEDAKPYMLEVLDHLKTIIELSLEFSDFLNGEYTCPPELEPRHTCEAIFGGVESFSYVVSSYWGSFGPTGSSIPESLCLSKLKTCFADIFTSFIAERDFERKCSLLLDLFRLQIVFASMEYK